MNTFLWYPTNLDDPIKKGIDSLLEFSNPGQQPPPYKYYVNEVKYNKADLSRVATKSGGSQMTWRWIKASLENEFPPSKVLDILDEGYGSLLTRVSKEGTIDHHVLNNEVRKIAGWH